MYVTHSVESTYDKGLCVCGGGLWFFKTKRFWHCLLGTDLSQRLFFKYLDFTVYSDNFVDKEQNPRWSAGMCGLQVCGLQFTLWGKYLDEEYAPFTA